MEQKQDVKPEVKPFEDWAILECFGHRRRGGRVSEVLMFGTKMCRIDIPLNDGKVQPEFYGGSAIFCLSPVSEDQARMVAKNNQPETVYAWERLQVRAITMSRWLDCPNRGACEKNIICPDCNVYQEAMAEIDAGPGDE